MESESRDLKTVPGSSTFTRPSFRTYSKYKMFTNMFHYAMKREKAIAVIGDMFTSRRRKKNARNTIDRCDVTITDLHDILINRMQERFTKTFLVKIFTYDTELFRQFLNDKYLFEVWEDVYKVIVDAGHIPNITYQFMLEHSMHETFISYVRDQLLK